MAYPSDRTGESAEEAEVGLLVNELISEIGARKVPDGIRLLATELQALIDERLAKHERQTSN